MIANQRVGAKAAAAMAAVALLVAGPVAGANDSPPPLRVDVDFPSGSGEVVEIDAQERRIRLRPSHHADRGWACWWFVRIEGLEPGETLTLEVGDAPWATPDRAAVSRDGRTWSQTQPGRLIGSRMRYRHVAEAAELWFAWGPPFTPQDAAELVDWAAGASSDARAWVLCTTRAGREVPALHVATAEREAEGDDPQPPYGIWIVARQHAWESGSSWVCRGLVEWLVSDDPRAARLRRIAQLTVVPVMDVDNVALGAGGKDQTPHDHNRDWTDAPHWQAVAEASQRILELDQAGRFDVFLDLHNPGPGSQRPFFYIAPRSILSDRGNRNLDRFLEAARHEIGGPLPFFGQTYESDAGYDERWRAISKNWVTLNGSDHILSITLETPWNTPYSTTAGYRQVGRQLGLALERYLRAEPRQPAARPGGGKTEAAE